jgi:6-phosphogluconolactonase
MAGFDLRRFPAPQPLAQAAASDWLREIPALPRVTPATASSLPPRPHPVISVALSGGRIAGEFFSALATQIKSDAHSFDGIHFFWSDERCVPPDHPESNFRLANESFLAPLRVPSAQIHRLRGEISPPEAATAAESELRAVTSCPPPNMPQIYLVLLGMGEDGHVASLFPGESEKQMASPAVYRSVTALKPPPLRLTLGYGALATARHVWVLASGQGKRQALQDSLAPAPRTPLGRVIQSRDCTRIYSDIS